MICKSGAALTVGSAKLKNVGFMRRHVVRGDRMDPKIQEFCLPPGAKKPKRC